MKVCAVICRKATCTIPDATFPSSRAQNRGFCALLPSRTPIFGHFEHKIAVFVRFCLSEPPFSGVSSTKSRFLCSESGKDAREEVDGASGITKMTFVKLIVHSNTHCYLRRPDHSPVPGAGRTTKKDDQQVLVVLFCFGLCLERFYSADCHLQRTGETIAPSSCSATSLPCAPI